MVINLLVHVYKIYVDEKIDHEIRIFIIYEMDFGNGVWKNRYCFSVYVLYPKCLGQHIKEILGNYG